MNHRDRRIAPFVERLLEADSRGVLLAWLDHDHDWCTCHQCDAFRVAAALVDLERRDGRLDS
jgi:hypothetical protein